MTESAVRKDSEGCTLYQSRCIAFSLTSDTTTKKKVLEISSYE